MKEAVALQEHVMKASSAQKEVHYRMVIQMSISSVTQTLVNALRVTLALKVLLHLSLANLELMDQIRRQQLVNPVQEEGTAMRKE